MSAEIVLSKIAKLANENQIFEDSNDLVFLHDNKKWIFLEEFKNDAENILQLIRISKIHKKKEFAFLSTDKQNLVVVYRNHVRIPQHDHYNVDRLLAIVYNNYKKSLFSNTETSVLNTYVTTKLFEALQTKHNENIKDLENKMRQKMSLPYKFLPTLCEYQKKSVLWLLKREVEKESLRPFFEKLVAKDNQTVVYKHIYTSFIQTESPTDIILPPGGILADEMGLGKTVEMIALILLNPCKQVNLCSEMEMFFSTLNVKRKRIQKSVFCTCSSNSTYKTIQCEKCSLWQHEKCVAFYDSEEDSGIVGPYICPSCWSHVIEEYGLFKTKATFIVSPNTIKMQWVSEIKRHVQPSLRIFLYEGVLSGKWISPRNLAEYDIVLTDYTTLRGDIYFTQNNRERTMRNKPRRMRVYTPILMLKWWRVLLDEAQMVESNTANVAVMVRMIPAINRWAVTGTPIQKSLNDLQPLLQFIGFDAANEPHVWHQIVNEFILQHEKQLNGNIDAACCAMINILQKCMWRTCKAQVASELNIPSQHEVIHRIEFNNLEKLFYNEQHAECRSKFLENVLKYSQRTSTISPQIMNIILQPFLKIRQSCTIPVVVATCNPSNFNSQQQKHFLQPQELHHYLKSTNEIACKSELRAMASSHNGLAALYFLQKKFEDAITNYEAVLKLANDYSDMNISVDSLLQIHALHNIMQIKIIQSDMTIQNLESNENQFHQLEWKYLSTYASNLATVKVAYETAIDKMRTNSDSADNFITTVAECVYSLPDSEELSLMQKIQEECIPRFGKTNAKLFEIRSTGTLLFVIELWFSKLMLVLNTLQEDIKNLSFFYENVRARNQVSPAIWRDIMQLVNSVYDCHLSKIRDVHKSKKEVQKEKTPEKKKLCKMCSVRNSMNEFECLLFDKVIDKSANYTEGMENPSFEMYICKLTFYFVKNKHRPLSSIMEKNWIYLENIQLVCKRLIKFWIEMEYTIKAYDELNMCKMRITLTEDADDKSIFKIMEHEIEGSIITQRNELMRAQHQFTIKMARLRYIKHLEEHDDPGPCPICRLTDADRYAVLECGHHICFSCLKSTRMYVKGNNFKCSICRNVQQSQKIYYVSREKIKNAENEIINGNYSSKITYLVRLILRLQRQHNEEDLSSNASFQTNTKENSVKILIFSQWEPIIQAIASALKENGVTYRAQCTPKSIEEFKNPKLGITCLLMPFIRGSKGLNLVEATHVFLVEPILNPGEELQAVGRVHRFGQTRPTTVHRFIVSQTIEENIYNFIISSSSNSNSTAGVQPKWEFNNISLAEFENLFSLQQAGDCD